MNSQIENTHIIFNEFARTTLTNNEEFNIKPSNIISLEDDLRIGPLSFFESRHEIEDRKRWLSNLLNRSILKDQILSKVENDNEKIDTILSNENQCKYYIWTGNNARDIISTARLISKLKKTRASIYMADFTKITLLASNGRSFSPQTLVEVNSSHVYTIFKHFQQVEAEQLIKLEKLWTKIATKPSLLRILDNDGGIRLEKETYFDNILRSFCTNDFQKTARIVGETLVETQFSIPSWFLNWRMIEMSEMKRIEFIGELKDMRDYKVRISAYNNGS